jgi:hypothetical protein
MKLALELKLPANYLRGVIAGLFRDIETQVNRLTEGRISAVHNAYTAAPTTGKHSLGDFVRNSQPAEAGGAGSMYVITGWICTVSGEPGTWLECRSLTGN